MGWDWRQAGVTANGPTVTGRELELGYYTEPQETGAKPHHHPSEQIIMVVSGRLRMRIDAEPRPRLALRGGKKDPPHWLSRPKYQRSSSRRIASITPIRLIPMSISRTMPRMMMSVRNDSRASSIM